MEAEWSLKWEWLTFPQRISETNVLHYFLKMRRWAKWQMKCQLLRASVKTEPGTRRPSLGSSTHQVTRLRHHWLETAGGPTTSPVSALPCFISVKQDRSRRHRPPGSLASPPATSPWLPSFQVCWPLCPSAPDPQAPARRVSTFTFALLTRGNTWPKMAAGSTRASPAQWGLSLPKIATPSPPLRPQCPAPLFTLCPSLPLVTNALCI